MKYTVLHSSSPLPLLHQAWQHPPAAGGDEPPTGWWQRSEWGKKQRALKIQRVTNHQRFLYRFRWWKVPEDPQRHLKTLKIKCERQQQPYVLKPHLFASNWLCIETRGFSCCEQSTRGVGYNSVHTVSHSVCVLLLLTVYRQCGYTPACSGLLYTHPLDVELHVLLGTALDLLLHFPHHCLHVYDAFFGDAGGESQEGGV